MPEQLFREGSIRQVIFDVLVAHPKGLTKREMDAAVGEELSRVGYKIGGPLLDGVVVKARQVGHLVEIKKGEKAADHHYTLALGKGTFTVALPKVKAEKPPTKASAKKVKKVKKDAEKTKARVRKPVEDDTADEGEEESEADDTNTEESEAEGSEPELSMEDMKEVSEFIDECLKEGCTAEELAQLVCDEFKTDDPTDTFEFTEMMARSAIRLRENKGDVKEVKEQQGYYKVVSKASKKSAAATE